jgi:GntR family transcriptional regulator
MQYRFVTRWKDVNMLIVVDPQSDVPVYRQLMEQVKFLIASGQLQAGDELPSTRTLSAELGVNPMTISKAYSYLERDSVLERRPGRPLVVKAFTAEQIRTRKVDLLRDSLTSTVTMVRQLEIDAEEALGIFREMLASAGLPVRRGKE